MAPLPSSLRGSTQKRIALAAFGFCLCAGFSGCGAGVGSVLSGSSGGLGSGGTRQVAAAATGPQLGYLWRAQDGTLRPISGIAGAAQIGASIVSPGAFASAAVAPSGAFALLVSSSGAVYRMNLPGGVPVVLSTRPVPGGEVRLSPSAATAVVYSPGTSSVQVLTMLGGSPQSRTVSATAPVLSAAASDSGSVAMVLATGKGFTVQVASSTGAAHTVGAITGSGGLSFVGASEDLLLADSGANTLTLVHSASSSSSPAITALPVGGLLKAPAAVNATANQRWAMVANGGDNAVIRVDLTGGTAPQRIACSCQPSVAEPLAGAGLFRFTALGTGPVWMADVTAASPSMLFIPALH